MTWEAWRTFDEIVRRLFFGLAAFGSLSCSRHAGRMRGVVTRSFPWLHLIGFRMFQVGMFYKVKSYHTASVTGIGKVLYISTWMIFASWNLMFSVRTSSFSLPKHSRDPATTSTIKTPRGPLPFFLFPASKTPHTCSMIRKGWKKMGNWGGPFFPTLDMLHLEMAMMIFPKLWLFFRHKNFNTKTRDVYVHMWHVQLQIYSAESCYRYSIW